MTYKLPKSVKANRKKSKQVCTTCGGDHWSPDCPETAKLMQNKEFLSRNAIEKALAYARELGYSPQLEISIPATKRQPIILRDIYLRPIDGSDQLYCSCCSNQYETRRDVYRGLLPNPLNWCSGCRELLREMSIGTALRIHEGARALEGRYVLIQKSVDQINEWIKSYARK